MASKRIAGITLEIDGNATKLNKALQGVDKQLSTTKATLKDVDKLLKLDPGNTDLLKQKQKLLGDEINTTKQRLETLKEAQKQALDPTEYDALQREIIETEGNLESLEKEYKEFGSVAGQHLQAVGDKVKDLGSKISSAGETLTKNVTVPLAAVGTAAIASAKDVDNGYDTIIKKTGATGDSFTGLKKQMDRVFTKLPTDAETAGAAIGEVNTRFGLLGDDLGDVSEQFIQFAEINDEDVATSVANVDKIMEAFGVDSSEVGNVLGKMTKTGQDTGLSMSTLSGELLKNGEYLKEMGLGLGDSIDLLGQFEANGVDSSTALAGLKKAQQNATKEGKTLSESLRDTIDRIKNAKTQTDALDEATELFGSKGALAMTNAIREGRFSLDALSGSIDNYGSVVQDTYEATLDPWDQMKVALNNLKLAGTELAGSLFEVLKPIIDKVVESVKSFTNWFQNLDEKQKNTIVRVGLLVAAIGPLLLVVGKIITAGGGIITGIGKLINSGAGIIQMISGGGGMIANIGSLLTAAAPFLLKGAIIVGIIAAIVLIIKNWDKIKAAAKAVKEVVSNAWNGLKTTVADGAKYMADAAINAWNSIKTGAQTAWNNIKTTVSTALNSVKTAASNGWNAVKTATSNAWNTIRGAVSTGINNVKSAVSSGMTNVKTAATNAWTGVKTVTSTAWGTIRGAVSSGISTVRTSVSTGMATVRTTLSTAWNTIATNARGAWTTVQTGATSAFNSIKTSATNLFSGIGEKISNTFSGIRDKIASPFENALAAVQKVANGIKNAFHFQIKLPHVKLPHIKVKWKDVGGLFKIPSISVSWYKKAYDNPVMFTRPTVLQTPTGAKGFGDGNGGEVVLGMDKLKQLVGASGDMNTTINVYAQSGMDVNALADAIQNRLAALQRQKEAVYA